MTPGADIHLVGLSHRTAPVAVRELFAFDDEQAASLARDLVKAGHVRESVVLCTCNRTEVCAVGPGQDLGAALVSALAQASGKSPSELSPHLYLLDGMDAVRHVFRVTCALDSMVVGEPQILGQVKRAFGIASGAGATGPILSRLYERAFKVAKEVRARTGVGTGQVSVGSLAVDLARRVFGDLSRSVVLLLGAGKMAEAITRTLAAAGAGRVLVANRTLERAVKVAESYGWQGTSLENLGGLLCDADVVIASLAAPRFVVDKATMRTVLMKRRYRPCFLIDVSMPRVLDPELGRLEGAYLYDLDDLDRMIRSGLDRRLQDVKKAEEMVTHEVANFERFLRATRVQPLIAAMGRKANELRDRELARALSELHGLTDDQRQVVSAMASSLVAKLISDPVMVLKEAAQRGEAGPLAEAAQKLFRIELDEAER